jgi:phospholipid/cholesterol/gamma-HCH transport system ATP-binding protein
MPLTRPELDIMVATGGQHPGCHDHMHDRGLWFQAMGPSGCGKSTLLWHLIALQRPAQGEILYDGQHFWQVEPEERERMMRRFGILYQSNALWSSMTLAENVALPLEQYTDLSPNQIRELVSLKLALVGLAGFEAYYPSELSGGMQKRCRVGAGDGPRSGYFLFR